MGSMGKRRGRRTRSDSPHEGDGQGWPEFRSNPWTWPGSVERSAALARGRRLIRARGGRRAISSSDLVLPILIAAVGAAILLGAVALVVRVFL